MRTYFCFLIPRTELSAHLYKRCALLLFVVCAFTNTDLNAQKCPNGLDSIQQVCIEVDCSGDLLITWDAHPSMCYSFSMPGVAPITNLREGKVSLTGSGVGVGPGMSFYINESCVNTTTLNPCNPPSGSTVSVDIYKGVFPRQNEAGIWKFASSSESTNTKDTASLFSTSNPVTNMDIGELAMFSGTVSKIIRPSGSSTTDAKYCIAASFVAGSLDSVSIIDNNIVGTKTSGALTSTQTSFEFCQEQSGIGAGTYTSRLIAFKGFCRDTIMLETVIAAGSDEPTMACHGMLQVSLTGSGTVISPEMMLPGQNTDNKISFIEGTDKNIVNCEHVGVPIRVVVMDTIFNQKCWGNVLVKDHSAVVVTARDTTISCLQSMDSLTAVKLLTLTDNCSTINDVEISFSDVFDTNDCNNGSDTLKIINRNWIIKDPNGAIVNATSKIAVTKIEMDSIKFPANVTLYCPDTISNVATLNFNLDTLMTKCKFQIGFSDLEIPVGCAGMRKVERKWVVIDWCNNQRRDTTQIITLLDTLPPVLQCPIGDMSGRRNIKTTLDTCGAYFVIPTVTAKDSCSDDNLISYTIRANGIIVSNMDSVLLPIGQNIMEYRATDDCGNTAMCFDTIQIEDGTAPTINGPSLIQVALAGNGNTLIPINLIIGAFNISDNCALDSVLIRRVTNTCGVSADTIFGNAINICCADSDTLVPIEILVKDKVGLSSQIIRTNIDVKDPISPNIVCSDTTIYLDVNGKFAVSDSSLFVSSFSDNCVGNLRFTYSIDTLDRTHLSNPVSLLVTVSDVEGNTDTCTSAVTVLDTFPAAMGLVIGKVLDPYEKGLGGMSVSLYNQNGEVLNVASTDTRGGFEFGNISSSDQSMISIEGYGEMMEGVSSLDLYLIQKHILGLTPLNNAYLELAADIDQSGALSVSDLLHLQNALLGKVGHLDLPWLYLLENVGASNVYIANEVIPFSNSGLRYRAVKMGDVNGNIYETASGRSAERSEVLVTDKDIKAQTMTSMPIDILVDENGFVSFNIKMNIDNAREIAFSKNKELPIEIEFYTNGENISILGYGDNDLMGRVHLGEVVLFLDESNTLSSALSKNNTVIGEIYNQDYQEIDLRLGYLNTPAHSNELADGNKIVEVFPNPAIDRVNFKLNMKPEDILSFKIMDVTGKQILDLSSVDTKDFSIPTTLFPAAGSYIVSIESMGGTQNDILLINKK